jgi:transcriptional regulator with XRE-family HTH domain
MRIRLKLDRLIEELSRSNRTQNHWAIKLGLSRGHLSELLNGKHPYPSQKTREKLIVGLGLEFSELFEAEADSDEWSHASSASFQAALSGRYLIDEEIGRGGMGTVYLAREVKHGRRVAIKVISPEAVTGVGAKQFLKEIRYTAQLQHHNILTLLDSGEAAGYPYYVMPYITGGSLRDRLRARGPLSVEETFSITRGVAAALAHAHDNRVVHCDVKPENILLSEDHALVADFGIARAVHAEVRALGKPTGIDSSAGTPAYVSPEQASGDPHIDGRTDVYSLGCVLFEMVTGEAPFAGKTTVEVVSRRFTDTVPAAVDRASHIPRGVSAVIQQAMAVDPARRHSSPRQLLEALGTAAAHGRRPIRDSIGLVWSKTRSRLRGPTTVSPGGRGESVWLGQVIQDVGYAVRGFRKHAAQTAVLLSTLALAIGVNSAVFSVFSAVLLRPLPFPSPDRLVAITEGARGGAARFTSSFANFADIRDQNTHFAAVAGFVGTEESVVGGDVPVFASARYVTGDFFRVLGVAPQIGTGLDVAEDGQTALIGDAVWRSTFGADPGVLGREIEVSGRRLTIIGVMPPRLFFSAHRAGVAAV